MGFGQACLFAQGSRLNTQYLISVFQIDDTLVSLDVVERCFLCDLSHCKGECCVEGDSGAPLEEEELPKLQEVLPIIWDDLSPEAQAIIQKQGVAYIDEAYEIRL